MIGPVQALAPPRFSSAPSLATPSPFRMSGSVMTPVPGATRSDEPVPTMVGAEVVPRASGLVMTSAPELLFSLIDPVNPVLSAVSVRTPGPSLVSVEPVVPLSLPEMVRSAPVLTEKDWSMPPDAPSRVSIARTSPSAPALTTRNPLPGVPGSPRVIALPDSVYPPSANVIELNTPLAGRSFWFALREAPAGKTRSSTFAGFPVGATFPTQLAAVLHLASVPNPVQVNVAGACRASNSSRYRRIGKGRRMDGVRTGRPVPRRPRAVFDMVRVPIRSCRTGEYKVNTGGTVAAQG